MRLRDRVYLITGGAGGIGAGTARAVLEEGGRAVLADLDGEAAQAAARRLDPSGDSACGWACDVTDPEQAERAAAETVSRFGRLDGAVNAAGAVFLDEAWDSRPQDWSRTFAINVTGSFLIARAVGRRLRETGGGAIVNVASNCGKAGYPNMAAYNSSKAAVIGLTRSLAMEWAADGVNVNALCPGGVDTPMLAGVAEWLSPRLETPAAQLLAGMGPVQLGRRVRPVEVGRVAAFLLSDDALIIRGQSISVDGGDTPY